MQILDMDTWKPMMADNEIAIIDRLIETRKPKRCLEWGSGNSTVYFSTKHDCITEWIAYEHKKVYLELLDKRLPKKAQILLKPNMHDYVNDAKTRGVFDFILIDGQERDACLEIALTRAHKNTIILLHDACRIESRHMMERYANRITLLCTGEKMQSNGFYAHRGLALFAPFAMDS